MTTRLALVGVARTWLHTRWQHQQSLKRYGCDCLGFIYGVALEGGVRNALEMSKDPAMLGYGRDPDSDALIAGCHRHLDEIQMADLMLADVLVMRFKRGPQHFALVSQVAPSYIMHAYAQVREVVENRLDAVWAGRVTHAFRFRGLVDG